MALLVGVPGERTRVVVIAGMQSAVSVSCNEGLGTGLQGIRPARSDVRAGHCRQFAITWQSRGR